PELTRKLSANSAEELAHRYQLERKRLEINAESISSQVAVQQAQVEQRRALAKLKHDQRDALHVQAGLAGVVQMIPVQVGQRLAPGTNLARVIQPDHLKAQVKVAETQAKDI